MFDIRKDIAAPCIPILGISTTESIICIIKGITDIFGMRFGLPTPAKYELNTDVD